MITDVTSLLADVVACRQVVDDYARRLDDACVEYYATGKSQFPTLSRAEDDDTHQRCELVLRNLAPIAPDALKQWQAIKYPSDQYDEQIERARDVWIRRRDLFRTLESSLKSKSEPGRPNEG